MFSVSMYCNRTTGTIQSVAVMCLSGASTYLHCDWLKSCRSFAPLSGFSFLQDQSEPCPLEVEIARNRRRGLTCTEIVLDAAQRWGRKLLVPAHEMDNLRPKVEVARLVRIATKWSLVVNKSRASCSKAIGLQPKV